MILYVLLLLLGVSFCGLALVSWQRIGRLERAVSELNARLPAPDPAATEASPPDPDIVATQTGASEPPPLPAGGNISAHAPRPADRPALASAVSRRWDDLRRVDLEELIGGRWTVLLGGVAVALGALFLVRYTIEAGLLGPQARIVAGVLLSAALLAGGEGLRRRDRRASLPPFFSADIPGALTGAGAIAAFGTLYAAQAIYGFIAPGPATLCMLAIAILCLVLASLHGPKLAAIGLLGGYGAPIVLDAIDPNLPYSLIHVLGVTAAVTATARIRQWRWLLHGGVVGSLVWLVLVFFATIGSAPMTPVVLLLIGLGVLYALGFGGAPSWQVEETETLRQDRPAFAAFAILTVIATVSFDTASPQLAMVLALGFGALLLALGRLYPTLCRAAPLIGLPVLGLALSLPVYPAISPALGGDALAGERSADISGYLAWLASGLVPLLIAAVALAWSVVRLAPRRAGQLAIAAALIAVLGLSGAYLRGTDLEIGTPLAAGGLILAAAAVLLAEAFLRQAPRDYRAPAPAALAIAAVALLSLALGFALSRYWLPLAMAVTSAGVAWIYKWRPFPAMPMVAVVLAALSFSGIYFNAPFEAEAIGALPFFNWLLLIAGLPSLMILWAGEVFRRGATSLRLRRWASGETAIGLAFLALFVALQLRHFIADGNVLFAPFGLADMAVQSIAALGFALGLQFTAMRSGAAVYDRAALIAGGLGFVMLIGGLAFRYNPVLTGAPVGEGAVFNLLLPAYLVTGLLAGGVALASRGVRPWWYRIGYGSAAGLLIFLYATLMVRHGFVGERMSLLGGSSDAELWTYSLVWLALGAVLLSAGLIRRSLPLRIASGVILLITVLKVFLFDMAALDGALRALSFIGLGLALLAIGRFYQKILLRQGRGPGRSGGQPDKSGGIAAD
ncbi:DUF2339 domain-containing protein [Pseudohoeflea coraliihabitans]|uniref:DUF2339 domain-containing protein n=1 Tax=Pseudohoeflea coraliihabitans TaxID=2860393 RepID=A0ABS6WPI0_9HYPH|nr:DUF2339 domain-containing protein [Pseudohoeflea sp. DP4N28-3]MBW3097876.1 DUF2339 domain-containing protein [Pseudohoeflea sp. DP4N28-3]